MQMKNVTITVVKSDKDTGYRLIVTDDATNDQNKEGHKSNISELTPSSRQGLISEVNKILNSIE
jgi:hypothetical protein